MSEVACGVGQMVDRVLCELSTGALESSPTMSWGGPPTQESWHIDGQLLQYEEAVRRNANHFHTYFIAGHLR